LPRLFKFPTLFQKVLRSLFPVLLLLAFLGIYALGALGLVWGLSHVDPRLAVFFQIQSWAEFKTLTGSIYVLFNYLQFAERYVYWVAGWYIFNTHPLLGVGLGNAGFYFQHALPAYGWRLPEVMLIYFQEAALPNIKSMWVRLLAETGIVGFSSFFTWYYVMFRSAWSMRLNQHRLFKVIGWFGLFVLVAFITEGFSTDTFALPYLWVSLGIVSAAGALLRNPKTDA
jgi:O-antigen ligase